MLARPRERCTARGNYRAKTLSRSSAFPRPEPSHCVFSGSVDRPARIAVYVDSNTSLRLPWPAVSVATPDAAFSVSRSQLTVDGPLRIRSRLLLYGHSGPKTGSLESGTSPTNRLGFGFRTSSSLARYDGWSYTDLSHSPQVTLFTSFAALKAFVARWGALWGTGRCYEAHAA